MATAAAAAAAAATTPGAPTTTPATGEETTKSSSDPQLFEDNFTITAINSAKYDRVSRISGRNLEQDIEFTLDVNTELYPCSVNETINMVLASTLAIDGTQDDEKGWREMSRGETTLADLFDYVCHGTVYRFEEGDGETMKVFVSFGGLLLYMVGPYKKLTPLRMDHIYLLMKK